MNRFAPTLFFSTALLLGAGTTQAASPTEATLYKNPQCGCCDEYARQLEERGVSVTIVDDVELGKVKERVGLPYGLGACHTIEMGEYVIEGMFPSWRWRNYSRSVRTPMASAWPACLSGPPGCRAQSRKTGTSTNSATGSPSLS